MSYRDDLDTEMRNVLLQLATCSHVPATGYEPRSRSGATESVILAGGDRGDAEKWARWYGPPFHEPTSRWPGAIDDEHREKLIEAARSELEQLRGHIDRPEPRGETLAQRNGRMLAEGEGFPARDVAVKFRCGERDVRKVRLAAGRDPDTGKPILEVATADRPTRAVEMKRAGASTREIAEALGAHQTQVMRWLRAPANTRGRAA